MKYVISILFNDRIFHLSFPEEKKVEISSSPQADLVVPELDHFISVSAKNGSINVSDVTKTGAENAFTMRLNYPRVLDDNCDVSLCVAEDLNCESIAWLGDNFSVTLGRKLTGKNNRKNDIVFPELPFVSQTHFQIVRKGGKTVIRDLSSTNGTFVNGRQVEEAELHRGDMISILTACIHYEGEYLRFNNTVVEPLLAESLCWNPHPGDFGTEMFKRAPRIQERLPGGKIEIPAPPAAANKPEINWLSTLLPAGITVAIAITMALALKNTMMMLYSLPMTVAGVFVSIANYFRGSKTYRKSIKDRRAAYLQKINEIKAEISEKRESQKRALLLSDPAPESCLAAVRSRSTKLWCREPDDSDFVSVRIGTGTVPFSVMLDCPREQLMEEDDLRKIPGEICRSNTLIEQMPVLCDIRSCGVVGLLGSAKMNRKQLQSMILQLATHHCCTELKLVCFFNEEDREELSWLSDLPHTHGASPEERYLASTQEEADALFRLFTDMFMQRKQEVQENNSYGNGPLFVPYILFIFFEPKLLKKTNPITQYLFAENGLGVGCLMSAQKIAELPKQCTEIITLSENGGEIYNTARSSERRSFCPDEVKPGFLQLFGQSMRPLFCDEGIVGNTLPKSYTLYRMLNVDSMASFDLEKSWKNSDLLTSELAPTAPIGILENGEQIFFSSPPTAENGGAHALVAGAAGSGKSETLLSMILSLALRYPPEEVGFLVIDFKGDSIASQIGGLPHLRGMITSLDGEELRRSLVSINAENRKRENLFKTYNENHPEEKKKVNGIRGYTKKYWEGKVSEPLPHLFIIVDEFAEMKKQLPDIMDEFISTAQIGRSLGVHLVLATQSPSGVVDSKIRANTLKQLCLKVANSGESRDMIGTDLAAHIKDSGRGYLKIDDTLQIFQSAYGGGKICLPDGSESTQLREAVDAIAAYCHSHGIQKLPDVFCPPLPKSAAYPQLCTKKPFGLLPIGIRDDPAHQIMEEYCLDVFSRNTLIIGSQMMGKTNLLQTILRGVAGRYSPDEVNVYILEFSSLFLKNFETLPQVGGVVTLQETEKIANLFRLLKDQVEQRRQKFMSLGVSTFSAYRESGAHEFPQILLLVDGLAAAKEYFPLDNDPLLSVCKEGLSLGISVVATALQPIGGISYLPAFSNRIALYNNDGTVYNTLLGHTSLRLKEIPGRCLVSLENTAYECQSFLAFDAIREIDRADAIRSFCLEQTEKAKGRHAVSIPCIPKEFTVYDALTKFPGAYTNGRLMFGLDYATVKPLSAKLAALGMLAVSGRENDVRNFQRYVLTSAEKADGLQAEFYIVDSIDRALQPLSGLSCVAEYSFLPAQAVQLLHQIREKAEGHFKYVSEGNISILDTSPVLVLMLNSNEAINAISSDKAALEAWLALTGKLKAMNVCTVFGALDNVSIPYSSEVLKKFKDDRKLVFFEDLSNLKIGDLPYAAVKKFPSVLQKGDGYLILGNDVARIRVPDCAVQDVD